MVTLDFNKCEKEELLRATNRYDKPTFRHYQNFHSEAHSIIVYTGRSLL
jgi:hypothetical protein